jgi:hypothetical protein
MQQGRCWPHCTIGVGRGSIAPTVTLKFISAARHVRMQLEADQDTRPFELWKDGRRELGQLATAN